jgi:hypothetical protein
MPIDEVGVRTMLMIARTLATVQTKSSLGTSTGSQMNLKKGLPRGRVRGVSESSSA